MKKNDNLLDSIYALIFGFLLIFIKFGRKILRSKYTSSAILKKMQSKMFSSNAKSVKIVISRIFRHMYRRTMSHLMQVIYIFINIDLHILPILLTEKTMLNCCKLMIGLKKYQFFCLITYFCKFGWEKSFWYDYNKILEKNEREMSIKEW